MKTPINESTFSPIFCLGLPKTGTHSMKRAMEILGYKVKYNNEEGWEALSKGTYRFDKNYDVTVHFGFHHGAYFRALYPNCRLIYVKRSGWIDTCERWFSGVSNLTKRQRLTRLLTFGMLGFHRAHFLSVYENQVILPGLVMNIEDGFSPLCEFLNRPVPDEDFPHYGRTQT